MKPRFFGAVTSYVTLTASGETLTGACDFFGAAMSPDTLTATREKKGTA